MVQNNFNVFSSPIFDLPKRRGVKSCDEFLDIIYDRYLENISCFNGEVKAKLSTKVSFIENQIDTIKESVSLYLQGFPSKAFGKLSGALTDLFDSEYLPIQKSELDSFSSPFYRVRISDMKVLKQVDLFHVPFEIREKVSTQRYSIPGLPCLYLADSIFVCWEELGRPDLDSFHVSRFDISDSKLRFLYFNTSSNDIRKKCFPGEEREGKLLNLLIPFLCCWPLLAACSLIVEKPNGVFMPEYIIPQLLLQWVVSEQKVDGVIYKSNKVNLSSHNIGTFRNVVIPVKSNRTESFCLDLANRIKVTQPISYQQLQISGDNVVAKPIKTSDMRRAMYVEVIEGERSVYSNTIFGKLENKLAYLNSSYIKLNIE